MIIPSLTVFGAIAWGFKYMVTHGNRNLEKTVKQHLKGYKYTLERKTVKGRKTIKILVQATNGEVYDLWREIQEKNKTGTDIIIDRM